MRLGYHPTPSTAAFDAVNYAGNIKLIGDLQIVRASQVYHNLSRSVEEQNDKMLAIRENVLSIAAVHALAPFVAMLAEDYFQLIAKESQLSAAIRTLETAK